MKKLILLLSILIIGLLSCDDTILSEDDPTMGLILVDEINKSELPDDAYIINSCEIQNDILTINVSYSGGCIDHDFELYISKFFMESWPVQAESFLSHDSKDDNCDSIVTEDLIVDLTPLKEVYQASYSTSTGAIKINNLCKDNLLYQF